MRRIGFLPGAFGDRLFRRLDNIQPITDNGQWSTAELIAKTDIDPGYSVAMILIRLQLKDQPSRRLQCDFERPPDFLRRNGVSCLDQDFSGVPADFSVGVPPIDSLYFLMHIRNDQALPRYHLVHNRMQRVAAEIEISVIL